MLLRVKYFTVIGNKGAEGKGANCSRKEFPGNLELGHFRMGEALGSCPGSVC